MEYPSNKSRKNHVRLKHPGSEEGMLLVQKNKQATHAQQSNNPIFELTKRLVQLEIEVDKLRNAISV